MSPMSPIEELLARAVLRDDVVAPPDVVSAPGASGSPVLGAPDAAGAFAGLDGLAALRLDALGLAPFDPDDQRQEASALGALDAVATAAALAGGHRPAPPRPAGTSGRGRAEAAADDDLRALCEAVVAHGAADSLPRFLTGCFPEPSGARVIGCVLQLTDVGYGARFWWQYAAGAGDAAASYCLYLQHLSLGEAAAAAWWRRQSGVDSDPGADPGAAAAQAPSGSPVAVVVPAAPAAPTGQGAPPDRVEIPVRTADLSTRTTLRVLRRLLREPARPRAEVVEAVLSYVPGAVHNDPNPDVELPLPEPDFEDHIGVLLAATGAGGPADRCRAGAAAPGLPARRRDGTRARERGRPRG
jgi:hypothetical protein